jgi:sorting nexin-7/30
MRQRGLKKFLERIASHPVLSFNNSFFQFLTISDEKLPELRKETSGLLSRFSDSLHASVAAMMLKNPDAQFANTSEYIENLRKQLGEVRRIEESITNEQTELLSSMKQLSMALQGWLTVDSDLMGILSQATHCTDKQIQSLETSVAGIEPSALQPLKEYYLYTDSVKQVLKRRDAIQMDYELALDELAKKEEELENARSAGQQEKVTTLEEKVKEVADGVDHKSDCVDVANTDLRAELDRWHSYKRTDMKEIFTDIADRQISFYQKSQEALKEAIEQLAKEDEAEAEAEAET